MLMHMAANPEMGQAFVNGRNGAMAQGEGCYYDPWLPEGCPAAPSLAIPATRFVC